MAVRRAKNQTRPKTAKAKMREDTRAGRRESSDSIPGRGKDATRAAVDKRRTMPRQTRQTLRMEEPAGALRPRAKPAKPVSTKPAEPAAPPSNISRPARPSAARGPMALDSMPFMKAAVLPDEQSLNRFMDSAPKEMKAGGKVKKDRRDGIALRGKTRA